MRSRATYNGRPGGNSAGRGRGTGPQARGLSGRVGTAQAPETTSGLKDPAAPGMGTVLVPGECPPVALLLHLWSWGQVVALLQGTSAGDQPHRLLWEMVTGLDLFSITKGLL